LHTVTNSSQYRCLL